MAPKSVKKLAVPLSATYDNAIQSLSRTYNKLKYPTLISDGLAEKYVQLIGAKRLSDSAVIDMTAGVGSLANAMCRDQRSLPKRLILVEKALYEPCVELTREAAQKTHISVHQNDPMSVALHSSILGKDMLGLGKEPDPQWVTPWDSKSPSKVVAVCSLSSKLGDLTFTHLLRWMWDRAGAHAFGRTPLYLFSPRPITERIVAGPGSSIYGRLAISAQALCKVELLHSEETESHFWPHSTLMDLILLDPLRVPLLKNCTLEDFEFAQRGLFMKNRSKVIDALQTLDPTNKSLAERISADILQKKARNLEVREFCHIAEAFATWPLKREFYSNELVSTMP